MARRVAVRLLEWLDNVRGDEVGGKTKDDARDVISETKDLATNLVSLDNSSGLQQNLG